MNPWNRNKSFTTSDGKWFMAHALRSWSWPQPSYSSNWCNPLELASYTTMVGYPKDLLINPDRVLFMVPNRHNEKIRMISTVWTCEPDLKITELLDWTMWSMIIQSMSTVQWAYPEFVLKIKKNELNSLYLCYVSIV